MVLSELLNANAQEDQENARFKWAMFGDEGQLNKRRKYADNGASAGAGPGPGPSSGQSTTLLAMDTSPDTAKDADDATDVSDPVSFMVLHMPEV